MFITDIKVLLKHRTHDEEGGTTHPPTWRRGSSVAALSTTSRLWLTDMGAHGEQGDGAGRDHTRAGLGTGRRSESQGRSHLRPRVLVDNLSGLDGAEVGVRILRLH